MHTKVIYKIRHKVTGQWKCQGIDQNFSNQFWYSGEWDKIYAVKALLTRNKEHFAFFNKKYGTLKGALEDMANWEIVSYNISSEESGVINPSLL